MRNLRGGREREGGDDVHGEASGIDDLRYESGDIMCLVVFCVCGQLWCRQL